MRVNVKVVDDYQKLLNEIPNLIQGFGLKKMYVADKIDMPYNTFSRKLKNKNFTPEEAREIALIINRHNQ